MFTFGRKREKECALRYLNDLSQFELIEAVVDGVHDLIEGRIEDDTLRPIISRAFIEGGSGVWEQTGSWLRKLVAEYPQFEALWREFSDHSNWKVRFRTACFLNEMSTIIATSIGDRLKQDRSKKVREMAVARMEEINS